jgi:hypothetical protein
MKVIVQHINQDRDTGAVLGFEDVAEVKYAEYNNPTFWYIEGDFTEATKDEPESFQVYPN